MSFRDKIGQLNIRLQHRADSQDLNTHAYHSSSYHKEFEGYTEYRQRDAKGKTKLVRVYTGAWYRQDISTTAYVLIRIAYVVLFAAMCALIILNGIYGGKYDTPKYLAFTELATILFLTALAYTMLINYVFAPRKMTIGDYKSCTRTFQFILKGVAVCFGVDAVFCLLGMLISGNPAAQSGIVMIIEFLAGSVIALLMLFIEKKIPYTETEGKGPESVHGVEVTN